MPRIAKWVGKEPELHPLFPYSESFRQAPTRRLHLELAGQLLRKCLVRRDYGRAFKLYSTILTTRILSEEFVWKVGCEILRQKQEYEPQCLQFLQKVSAMSTYCRESIILETALYQLRFGMLDEARKTLEPAISMHPFNENPLLVGYAGLTEFALWSRATRESRLEARQEGHLDPDELVNTMEQEQESDDWFDEEDSERSNANQWRSSISKYGRSAANLLEQALRISPKNDTFLVYLVRLKCGKIDLAGLGSKKISRRRKKAIHEMRIYLKRHYSNNNDSVLSLQYVDWNASDCSEDADRSAMRSHRSAVLTDFHHYYNNVRLLAALENREKLKTLELILSHDPASDSRLYMQPLLQLLWSQIPNDQQILIDKIKKGQASAERELDHKAILSSLPTQAYESRRTKAWFRRTIPFFNAPPPPSLTKSQVETASTFLCHQPEVKHLRPILQILLTRAEFGFLTEEEEQDLVRTCDLFCFCSLYCQRLKSMEDMLQAPKSVSSFDDLPEHQQPAWYGKLAAILRRPDTP